MSVEEGRYRPLGQAAASEPAGGHRPLPHRKLALVTGGHRRLGAVIAAALAEAGFTLAIHGSQDTRLDSALALALEKHETDWHGFVADFADPESAEDLVAAVAAHFARPPDLLVNCAAIFGQDRLEDVGADDLMRHYAVNCAAPALLTKAFATVPAGGGDRCIVNTQNPAHFVAFRKDTAGVWWLIDSAPRASQRKMTPEDYIRERMQDPQNGFIAVTTLRS